MNWLRKAVRVLQFFALVVIPIVTVASAWGWEFFLAAPVAILAFLGLLVGPIITLRSRTVRLSGTAPAAYAVLSIAIWVVSIVFPLALEHSSDATSSPSPLEGIGLDRATDGVVLWASVGLCVALWIASIIALVVGTPRAEPASVAAPGSVA
jgi:hypothetical protein